MIKDKIIQKKIKGKVLAVAMTAVMASLFVPMVGNAAEDISNISCNLPITAAQMNTDPGAVLKSTDGCMKDGVCQGHYVSEPAPTAVGIDVESGHHYIKLQNANIISTKGSAIKVQNGAKLTLIVDGGDNRLEGSDAGIYVSQKADLAIVSKSGKDTDILKVKSNGMGSGIGGYGINGNNVTSGGITIESGTIVAEGGTGSAGIGGSGFGTVFSEKSITINGGTVIAKGGDGVDGSQDKENRLGAPGIGHGNNGGSGNIVINGGDVTAIGGMNGDENTHAAGIAGGTLTSVNGGGQTVLISDGIDVAADYLSGLVWDLNRGIDGKLVDKNDKPYEVGKFIETVLKDAGVTHGRICTVHNQAAITSKFVEDFNDFTEIGKQNILRIPSGASLRIPADMDFYTNGRIEAEPNSTLINPENLHIQTINGISGMWTNSDQMNYKVSFSPDRDITMKGPFVYKGEAYKGDVLPSNEIFEVATNAQVEIGSGGKQMCPVDRIGLTHKFTSSNSTSTDPDKGVEVKDAGNYTLELTYGGKTTEIKFEVEKLSINSSEIEVSRILDKEYKGGVFEASEFEGEVDVIYNGKSVDRQDYGLIFKQDYEKVGTATLTIAGAHNFKDERNVSFEITPVQLNDENATVKLVGGDSIRYDGKSHQPSIESIEVKSSSGAPLQVSDWGKPVFECSAGENNFTDAGDITVKIVPKDGNFKGECSAKFTILPRQLQVISITPTRTERPYDGTALVKISEVEIDLSADGPNGDKQDVILSTDRTEIEGIEDGIVQLPVSLTGTLCGEDGNPMKVPAGVKSDGSGYDQVFLDKDMCLAGAKGRNYTLSGTYKVSNPDNFKLTSAIIVTKRDAPVVEIIGEPIPDEVNEPKFICNLLLKGRDPEKDVIDPESPIYYYRCTGEGEEPPAKDDLGSWQVGTPGSLSVSVGNLAPNSEETFYVMVGATPNVAGAEPQVCSVAIPKYPRKAGPLAEECRLAASETPNEDGETYKLTVEPAQIISEVYPDGRYLYSLSEEGPYIGGDPSSLFNNVEPKTEYTAYVKYAATDEYTESETGTPTNSVTTNEGKAQKPTVTCNGTTQSEGEIHFSGTASVSLEYTGGLQNYEIRFTKDGTQPTASSELYGAPFEVSESITVNAFVIKPGVASSEVTSVKLVRDGDNPNNPSSGTEVELQRLTEETAPDLLAATPELPAKGIATFDAVSTPLATPILQQRGYENNNITYADLKIKIKGTGNYATEQDFKNAAGGVIRVTITMDQLKAIGLPSSFDGTTHNFAVTHMFATGTQAGNVETIGTAHNFSKSQDGKSISFDMTSTSPVAFGWADVNNSDPNPVDPGTDDPGNQDPGNQDPGNQDPGNQDPGTQDPNTIVGEGDPRQAAQGTQGTGTTTGTSAGTQGASNDAANALSGIMPKTGDPLSFVPWIAAIVISVGAIAFFATRKKDKKKQTVKKTQAAKKKK